jgi:hypothetical protein
MIEIEYEKQLRSGNVTGAIFALKNFGWRDTQHNVNENKEPLKIEVTTIDQANKLKDL